MRGRGSDRKDSIQLGWPVLVVAVAACSILDFSLKRSCVTMMAASHNTWLVGSRGKIYLLASAYCWSKFHSMRH